MHASVYMAPRTQIDGIRLYRYTPTNRNCLFSVHALEESPCSFDIDLCCVKAMYLWVYFVSPISHGSSSIRYNALYNRKEEWNMSSCLFLSVCPPFDLFRRHSVSRSLSCTVYGCFENSFPNCELFIPYGVLCTYYYSSICSLLYAIYYNTRLPCSSSDSLAHITRPAV